MAQSLTKDRIQEMLDDLDITQAEMARAARCTRGLVNQWLSGEVKRVGQEHAEHLQERYGYSAKWIRSGVGPKRIDTATRQVVEAMGKMSPEERQRIARMISAAREGS